MLSPLTDFSHFQSLIDTQTNFLIYKYNSNNCRLSTKTKPKVEQFLLDHPEISGYVVDVIEQTALKVQIAEYVNIPHESPQILYFVDGMLMENTSHMKISEQWLEEIFSTTS